MEIGSLDYGKDKKVPLTAMALICAQRMSHKVVDGLCRDIPVTKVKALRGKNMKPKVLEMEGILEGSRKLIDTFGLDRRAEACVSVLGWLSLHCVSVLCDLPSHWEKHEWDGMASVSED